MDRGCHLDRADRLYFLDGLRGWAALVVVLGHVFMLWLLNPDGLAASANERLLTIINASPAGVLMDGALAVHVFFVISGFALSYPVLAGSSKVKTLLTIAAFRYQRLVIPIFMSCLFALAVWPFFNNIEAGRVSGSGLLAAFYNFTPRWQDLFRFSFYDVFFRYSFTETWNPVLWTMRTELYGSFAIFLLLAAIPHRATRLVVAAIWTIYYFQTGYACFPAGYIIAELLFIDKRRSEVLAALLLGIALVSAILCRTSALANPVPMNAIAITILSGVVLSERCQILLSNPLSRFLGRISFSLYLIHVPIICSIGSAIYLQVAPSYGFLATAAIVGPLVVAIAVLCAILFHTIVDDKIVGFAKTATSALVTRLLAVFPDNLRPSFTRKPAAGPAISINTDIK